MSLSKYRSQILFAGVKKVIEEKITIVNKVRYVTTHHMKVISLLHDG